MIGPLKKATLDPLLKKATLDPLLKKGHLGSGSTLKGKMDLEKVNFYRTRPWKATRPPDRKYVGGK